MQFFFMHQLFSVKLANNKTLIRPIRTNLPSNSYKSTDQNVKCNTHYQLIVVLNKAGIII